MQKKGNKKLSHKEKLGTVLVFLTAIISGFSIFINKIFVVNLDSVVFTALRGIIIGIIFLILSFIFGSWKSKESKKFRWGYLLVIGIIGGGIAFLLFFTGLKLTTSGRAGFFHKTLPLYVLVFAYFFLKEKITKKQLFALLIMFAGTMIMISSTIEPSEFWLNPKLGDLLVIGATILWAVENTISRKAMIKGEHNFVVSFGRMFIGGLLLGAIIFATGKFSLILELTGRQWLNIFVSTALLFLYVFSFYWGIKYINVSKATTILLLSPIITLILGRIFLGEPMPALQLIGSVIILIGAYFVAGVKSELEAN